MRKYLVAILLVMIVFGLLSSLTQMSGKMASAAGSSPTPTPVTYKNIQELYAAHGITDMSNFLEQGSDIAQKLNNNTSTYWFPIMDGWDHDHLIERAVYDDTIFQANDVRTLQYRQDATQACLRQQNSVKNLQFNHKVSTFNTSKEINDETKNLVEVKNLRGLTDWSGLKVKFNASTAPKFEAMLDELSSAGVLNEVYLLASIRSLKGTEVFYMMGYPVIFPVEDNPTPYGYTAGMALTGSPTYGAYKGFLDSINPDALQKRLNDLIEAGKCPTLQGIDDLITDPSYHKAMNIILKYGVLIDTTWPHSTVIGTDGKFVFNGLINPAFTIVFLSDDVRIDITHIATAPAQ